MTNIKEKLKKGFVEWGKEKTNGSIKVNEDVWFYVNPQSLDFVVWVEIDGKRKASQFRLTKKKVLKYLI